MNSLSVEVRSVRVGTGALDQSSSLEDLKFQTMSLGKGMVFWWQSYFSCTLTKKRKLVGHVGSGNMLRKEDNMDVKTGEGRRSHEEQKVIALSREEQWMGE